MSLLEQHVARALCEDLRQESAQVRLVRRAQRLRRSRRLAERARRLAATPAVWADSAGVLRQAG
jgi:hypothetical protein